MVFSAPTSTTVRPTISVVLRSVPTASKCRWRRRTARFSRRSSTMCSIQQWSKRLWRWPCRTFVTSRERSRM